MVLIGVYFWRETTFPTAHQKPTGFSEVLDRYSRIIQVDLFFWSKAMLKNSDSSGQCPMPLKEPLV